MYLSRLRLTNFRNLVQVDLALPQGIVVCFGPNAQGKTTLLEAVYLLAVARSFRADNEREVINFRGASLGEGALVGGTVETRDDRLQVFVGYRPVNNASEGRATAVRKEIRVNRQRRTSSQLVGMVNAVLFSPEDTSLVLGPPAGRRRYLDILISQSDPIYLKTLQRYQRVVLQRNQLLRLLKEGRANRDELEFWDEELVREGSWVTCRRIEVMRDLSVWCARHYRELGSEDEEIQVEYRPSIPSADSPGATEDAFRQALAAAESRERATAVTAVGPHRDDFNLLINEADMSTFASRGQARTLALSLRLAEAEFIYKARQEEPILLLDDVLSEMDAQRRRRVLEKTSNYQQVFITATDLEEAQGFFGQGAAYFKVFGGDVIPWETSP